MTIRLARLSEMDWINARYDEVEFVHSHFDREIIAIAEWEGKKAGLGRLVRLENGDLELGGMLVLESFRNRGLAGKIVQFLLDRAEKKQTIYCIPFAHLSSFYQKFGFQPCTDLGRLPKDLLKKVLWCKEKYAHPTLLFVKSGTG